MSRRSMSPEFDQRIADWLEDDPDDAPDAVLATVLAAFPSIPQRRTSRVPWRTRPMTMTNRLLAGAAAVAVVLVGGVIILRPGGGPSVAASQPPSSSPAAPAQSAQASNLSTALVLNKTFTSDRYGYTLAYPGAWTASRASLSWKAGEVNLWGSGINDELKGSDIRFTGSAQMLAAGQTADQWLATYAGSADATSWPAVTIDGVPGKIGSDGVPANGGMMGSGGRMFDMVVVSGRLAFNFSMDGNVNRSTFDAVLATVRLPVIPTLDGSFASAINGLSIGYPSHRRVRPATKAWTSGYDASDPALSDAIGNTPYFAATSTRIPTAMSFETWYAAYDATRASETCGAPAAEESVIVDGVVGRLDLHCPTSYLQAVVATGGRAYVLTLYAPVTRPLFETFLATVKLTPATAKN